MPANRVFLGWDRPFLASAVEWLYQQDQPRGLWNLDRRILVVPGGRAKRRLLELLVSVRSVDGSSGALHGDGPSGVIPPRIVTLGELPELLYPSAPCNPLRSLLAMVRALQFTDPESLGRWIRNRPEPEDLPAWSVIARDVLRLDQELAAGLVRFAEVAVRCREIAAPASVVARWELLAEIHRRYLELLTASGLDDQQEARRRAAETRQHTEVGPITLLAVADLNPLAEKLLENSGAAVEALIFAPKSEAAGFDGWGGLCVDHWHLAELPLDRATMRIVDRPHDQALAVAEQLAEFGGGFAADQITVGLGDAALGGGIEQALELCEVVVRQPAGQDVPHSRPALLLSALSRLLPEGRSDHYAQVLRHPDLSIWLQVRSAGEFATDQWLVQLDEYMQEHLPVSFGPNWSGRPEKRAALEFAIGNIRNLLDRLSESVQPLGAWARPFAELLAEVYGTRTWHRHAPEDEAVLVALEQIGEELAALAELEPGQPLTPAVSLGGAVRFLLQQLAGKAVPLPAEPGAVDLLGWLELPLDDAPALIVTGVNDGTVPESVNADAFLPDRLRRELGLVDNRRRYARDALALRTMAESRQQLTLISGRRGAAGDPLMPSRLLLACDDNLLVERVLQFYAGEEMHTPARQLLRHGDRCRLVLPSPEQAAALERLTVTAFADYLACPYRFYLKHVRKLRRPDDSALELDPRLFGNLIHAALARFGESELKFAEDVSVIRDCLEVALEEELQSYFGAQRLPAVELQAIQLRRRLATFAEWQAQHTADGWSIWKTEQKAEAVVPELDPIFRIEGRIDRIDHHVDGRWLLLDYKSGETGRTPDQQHRVTRDGVRCWANLQLPLYRHLAQYGLGLEAGQVEVGYVALPRQAPKEGLLQLAAWSPGELREADATARAVIDCVRGGLFWPPGEPARHPDGLEGICSDRCLDRTGLIRTSPIGSRSE